MTIDPYFVDTETVGFQGDTVLIQYCTQKKSDIILHGVFKESVNSTLELLHNIAYNGIIGFNLSFDIFHLAQTLNILTIYKEVHGGDSPPIILNYYNIIDKYGSHTRAISGEQSIYDLCFKPVTAFDLLLHGREGLFQAQMNQKPIHIRKFPIKFATDMINYLKENVEIPDLYYGRKPEKKHDWQIKYLHASSSDEITPEEYSKNAKNPDEYPIETDENWCNLKLSFYPSTSLKSLAKIVLGKTDVLTFEDHDSKGLVEFGYKPIAGDYRYHIQNHINKWADDPREKKYARDDVVNTRELLAFFYWVQIMGENMDDFKDLTIDERRRIAESTPLEEMFKIGTGTTNHNLAVEVGNTYWAGYSLDTDLVQKLYHEKSANDIDNHKKVNFNAPRKSLEYILNYANEYEKAYITNTRKETLETLVKEIYEICEEEKITIEEAFDQRVSLGLELAFSAKFIQESRKNAKATQLLEKLNHAKRLHCSFKVLGTKSNRMAGGAVGKSKGGSINPQGINARGGLRACVTFTDFEEVLEGGDFSGFEIAIMEAVYQDPDLREELKSGKKFHAIWGSILYDLTYDEMLLPENEVLYKKAKFSVFAEAYGADLPKLAELTGLTVEQVARAKEYFQKKYKKIGENKKWLQEAFSALVQNNTSGHIEWKEPSGYVESMLGFKRFFTIEYEIMRALYNLGRDLPDEFKKGGDERFERKNGKFQTLESGARSAIFGSAFSLQNQVIRASGNHLIQSVGGEITKRLQEKFWTIQPDGIHKFIIKPFNVHDEIDIPMKRGLESRVNKIRDDFINEYKEMIPMLVMDWSVGSNWEEIH